MSLRHVSFDLDGTLVDSFDIMRQSWEAATRELSITCGFERYRRLVGLPFPAILARLGLSNFEPELQRLYFSGTRARQDEVKVIDGARALLDLCRDRGLGTSVITSKPRRNAAPLLEAMGLRVDLLLCADDVAKGKPDPLSARILQERTGLAASEILYVGDMVFDFQFALNAGMPFLHVDQAGAHPMPTNLRNTVARVTRLSDVAAHLP